MELLLQNINYIIFCTIRKVVQNGRLVSISVCNIRDVFLLQTGEIRTQPRATRGIPGLSARLNAVSALLRGYH